MQFLLPDRVWLWISAVLYAASFVVSTWTLLAHRKRPRGVLIGLIALGLGTQTIGLYQRGIAVHGCPLTNTFEIVQFVIWSLIVLYLIVGPAFRVSVLGYFTSGLAAALSLTSLAITHWDVPGERSMLGGNPWIEIHATLALFAYGAFGTLALTSLMFLLQNFSLKRKRLRGVFSLLPPIVALETINFRLLLTGLAVLSFSIVVGAIYYQRDPESVPASKLLIATAVWAAYVVVLILRARRLLVSRSLAWACLALFGVALLSLDMINARVHAKTPAAHIPSSAVP